MIARPPPPTTRGRLGDEAQLLIARYAPLFDTFWAHMRAFYATHPAAPPHGIRIWRSGRLIGVARG